MTEQQKNDDLPPGVLRQRRNLILASALLITYELAGGEFTSASLPVVGVKFNNPTFLHFAAWVVFFYLWGRFAIYATSAFREVESELVYLAATNPVYKELGLSVYQARVGAGHWALIEKHPKAHEFIKGYSSPHLARKLFRREFHYSQFILDSGVDKETVFTEAPKVKISIFQTLGSELRAWRLIAREKLFFDYVFPQLLAVVTVCVGVNRIAEIALS